MKTTITALVSLILIAGGVGCGKRRASPAWERWGIAQPTPDSAEAELVVAHQLLYPAVYDSARTMYESLSAAAGQA
jgi:hypothetical protein